MRYDDFDGLPQHIVGGAVEDNEHFLWFATWNGLCRYDGYEFNTFTMKPGDGSTINTNQIRDILLASDGNILCHTDNGIFEFDLASYVYRDIEASRHKALKPLMGKTWKGITDTQGVHWSFDGTHICKTYDVDYPAKPVEATVGKRARALLYDSKHRLWIGTREDNTIRLYYGNRLLSSVIFASPPYCIFEYHDGSIWIGCKPGGLYRCVVRDSSIIAERKGNECVYNMAEDADGNLWLACFDDGAKCCSNASSDNPVISSPLGGVKVHDILVTKSNMLLVATAHGLLYGKIDRKNAAATILKSVERDGKDASSIASNSLMALAQNSHGIIYIGTSSSGIDIIDEKQLQEGLMGGRLAFKHFTTENSTLTNNACCSMALADDTTLMIVSTRSVMAFSPYSDNTITFGPSFWDESCHMSEAVPQQMADGTWVFGTEKGAYTASRHSMMSKEYIPPVVFTQITTDGSPTIYAIHSRDTLTFALGERNISISFAAIDHIDNSGILYRTRLHRNTMIAKDDAGWSHGTSDRRVTLFALAPGTYTLQVQSTDRYGRWVDNMECITFIIEPYWYETVWAEILLLLLIIGITTGVIYTYLHFKKIEAQRKETLEKYLALLTTQSRTRNDDKDGTSEQIRTEPIQRMAISDANEPSAGEMKKEDREFLERVRCYIDENIGNSNAGIDDMAQAAAVSRSTLNRRLRSLMGITAAQLLIDARMRRARQMLAEEDALAVSEIAYRCGFSDAHYFSRCFKQKYGVTPTESR